MSKTVGARINPVGVLAQLEKMATTTTVEGAPHGIGAFYKRLVVCLRQLSDRIDALDKRLDKSDELTADVEQWQNEVESLREAVRQLSNRAILHPEYP